MATIYHPIQLKSCEKIKKFEKDECIFNKFYNLTVNTYNSIRKLLPMFYKKYIRKPMFIKKYYNYLIRVLKILKIGLVLTIVLQQFVIVEVLIRLLDICVINYIHKYTYNCKYISGMKTTIIV